MKHKTLTCSAMILAASVFSSSVFAEDVGSGTIEFNGVVNTGACTIAPSSVNKEVNLGSVPVTSLATIGSQGPLSPFELELTNCVLNPTGAEDAEYSKVSATFTGSTTATNLWTNTGTASNVAVAFLNGEGTVIKSGDSVEQTLNAGTTVINLSARMQATGTATAGTVKSTAVYVLSYN